MNSIDDKVGVWAFRVFISLVLLCSLALLASCSVIHNDTAVSLMQLAPGDDVQSRTSTIIGIEAAPLGIDGPVLRLGYVRSQQTRVPAYEQPMLTPSVRVQTKVDERGIIVDEILEVGDDPPAKKGWF